MTKCNRDWSVGDRFEDDFYNVHTIVLIFKGKLYYYEKEKLKCVTASSACYIPSESYVEGLKRQYRERGLRHPDGNREASPSMLLSRGNGSGYRKGNYSHLR